MLLLLLQIALLAQNPKLIQNTTVRVEEIYGPCSTDHPKPPCSHDGDTPKVRLALRAYTGVLTVRLKDIDTPEIDQPHGPNSQAVMATLTQIEAPLILKTYRTDRWGKRIEGELFVGALDLNLALVEAGAAWVYDPNGKRRKSFLRGKMRNERLLELMTAEDNARHQRRGLWKDANAEAPWAYRKRMKLKEIN